MTDPALIWSYLAREPLLWLTATLVAYLLGEAVSRASGRKPIANPVLIAVAYNAGPSRASRWSEANGDPRAGSVDMSTGSSKSRSTKPEIT